VREKVRDRVDMDEALLSSHILSLPGPRSGWSWQALLHSPSTPLCLADGLWLTRGPRPDPAVGRPVDRVPNHVLDKVDVVRNDSCREVVAHALQGIQDEGHLAILPLSDNLRERERERGGDCVCVYVCVCERVCAPPPRLSPPTSPSSLLSP
jgi:hypothetical protein